MELHGDEGCNQEKRRIGEELCLEGIVGEKRVE